ncbi:Hypothetical predicted protein [Cloeon dipterum]|uniref:Uncharacterized protein n=1 Tax=Cloeon dipterum TaxID=197152 RepID=A0A8S1DQF3_9INSE|nr:Hypothetical predicted protein [Cloeon dipterum]
MVWINYHKEYLVKSKKDGVIVGFNRSELPIFVARTFYEGHFVPGYAVNGVGYFVFKERQPFQTTNFQVLVGEKTRFSKSHDKGIVADEKDQKMRFLIGSFCIEEKRFCGQVVDTKTCYINFDGQVVTRDTPDFEFIVCKTTTFPVVNFGELNRIIDTIQARVASMQPYLDEIQQNRDEISSEITRRRMQ